MITKRKVIRETALAVFVCVAAVFATYCAKSDGQAAGGDGGTGGGGGGGSTVTVGGTVSGLSGNLTFTMAGGSSQTKTVSANGSYAFDTQVATGSSITITIANSDANKFCYLENATNQKRDEQAISVSASVSNVNATCVNRLILNEVRSNACSGGTDPGQDFVEVVNKSGANITVSGSDWYLCDGNGTTGCGSTWNGITTEPSELYPIPAGTINNNSYGVYCNTGGTGCTATTMPFGIGNGDSIYLIYKNGGKHYLVESYIFTSHVTPGRKSPDGDFNITTKTGTWVTGGNCTPGTANP